MSKSKKEERMDAYAQRIQQVAEDLRILGKSEAEIEDFRAKATAARDRRLMHFYMRRALGFWSRVGDSKALVEDILARTEPLFDALTAQMHVAEMSGERVYVAPQKMRLNGYRAIPFSVRGYRIMRISYQGRYPMLKRPMPQVVLKRVSLLDETLPLARYLASSPLNAQIVQRMLDLADDEGVFALPMRFYAEFFTDDKSANRRVRRRAAFILDTLRRDGLVVLLKRGTVIAPSVNRFVSPQLVRDALALGRALYAATKL
ncbi:MAG: hypothetical protein ACK4JD_13100 [Thermoflexales bacterium]